MIREPQGRITPPQKRITRSIPLSPESGVFNFKVLTGYTKCMISFDKRYKSLNANQKQAVDTIEGPVMVVAGPGTGKTELLSVRVANILRRTDAVAQNILCLTFTDSGAVAMRERLAGLIGPEAYKVAIHTFHSFGSEIINHRGQYFYNGAHFKPADELSTYEIMSEILETLPSDNPIAGTMNGAYTHLKDILSAISDLKRGGLTSDELKAVLTENDKFCEWIEPRLQTAFGARFSKKQFPAIESLIAEISAYASKSLDLIGYEPLNELVLSSLQSALDDSVSQGSTKPLTAWKRLYLTKDSSDKHVLKDAVRAKKLQALADVYYRYLLAMEERELFDYDDMILRVVHAMEVHDDLRYDLQETYQYILVDEFQDTNDAQMRIVWNLTNNPVNEGRPNLMVVGDDDQAIYRFQGANMSNILDFTKRYRDVAIIPLTDNYRSAQPILEIARSVIVQGSERLETILNVDKTLNPHHLNAGASTARHEYDNQSLARHHLAEQILADYKSDSSRSRAIIGRNHRHLTALLPHLQACGLPLRYERQDNIFDSEPVIQLELVSRVVQYIADQRFDDANALLPELLAHPAWRIPPQALWQLSLKASKGRVFWLEEMLNMEGTIREIAEWLIVAAHYALTEPLEYMTDLLFGANDIQLPDLAQDDALETETVASEDYVSPYRAYFFPSESLETQPGKYVSWLSALSKLRHRLREFRPNTRLKLSDLIDFIDLHRDMELAIQNSGEVENDASSITLLTAHKSKGLEFDDVYITDLQEDVWGSSARSRSRLIQFPSNLPLAPAGDSDDERLRLLYVALTRAKNTISLYSANSNDLGKKIMPVGSISEDVLEPQQHLSSDSFAQIQASENDWRAPLYDLPMSTKDEILRPLLNNYQLSATHLNHFLDVTKGGPQLFLINNLLRFPQSKSLSSIYGSAVHLALQRAHAHLTAQGKPRPIEDVLHDFEEAINSAPLSKELASKLSQRGSKALDLFLAQRYSSFKPSQLTERNFSAESIHVEDVVITGMIDLIDIDSDEKTIFITDYKTGKPSKNWRGSTVYEKIKLHQYEQQLMIYKLLVENSRQFVGYTITGARLEFVEPDANGEIVLLDYNYDDEKLSHFKALLQAVWKRIQKLDFEPFAGDGISVADIIAFETSLLEND